MTKWSERVDHPSQARGWSPAPSRRVLSGRQGLAALEAPWEFFTRTAPAPGVAPLPLAPKPEPDPAWVRRGGQAAARGQTPDDLRRRRALHATNHHRWPRPWKRRSSPCAAARDRQRGPPRSASTWDPRPAWPQTDVAVVIGTRFELLDIRWRWSARPG